MSFSRALAPRQVTTPPGGAGLQVPSRGTPQRPHTSYGRSPSRNPLLNMPILGRLVLGFLIPALIAALALSVSSVQSVQLLDHESLFYQRLVQTYTSLSTAGSYLVLLHAKTQGTLGDATQAHPSRETLRDDQAAIGGLITRYTTLLTTAYQQDLLSHDAELASLLTEAGHTTQMEEQQNLTANALSTWQLYRTALASVAQALAAGNLSKVQELTSTEAEPAYTGAMSALRTLIQFDGQLVSVIHDATSVEEQHQRLTSLLAVLGVLLSIGMVGWLVSSTLVQRLQQLRQVVQSVEQGQFETRLAVAGRDEIARVSSSVNTMLDTIVGLLEETRRQRDELANAEVLKRMHQELQSQHDALNKALARLEALATTDPLTELGNHRAYQEDVTREVERARLSGEPLALACINIDELKAINDEHGHLHGDGVLRGLADVLRAMRATYYAFRLGGDTFAMLLPNTCLHDAMESMHVLHQEAEHRLPGATISIGVATASSEKLDVAVLYEQAEAAVQEAKKGGRNTTVAFEDVRERVSLIAPEKVQAFRRLLSEHKLTIAFQPIWQCAQGAILGFEALTRPAVEYGFAGPQEAFDIAEKMGRAHELDVICVQAILARAGELPPTALLFLNITPQTLIHDLLNEADLLEAAVSAGLTAQRIVLEITERSIVQIEVLVQKAKHLQRLGFGLALDDVGAGNAGLEMLSQVSVDFVKIDRAVVANALSDKAARSVLAGIIAMAREADISVIAEGIENTAMLELVRQAGVQAMQGYLLGRPSETIPDERALQERNPLAPVC